MAHKKKGKKTRPLKISVRGEGLEIDVKISDDHLSEVLTDAIKRLNGQVPQARVAETAKSPLAELIREFFTSLRKEQVESLVNLLEEPQKMLFMEIANHVST